MSPRADGVTVGGFERLSLVDRPGRLAAVVFCAGCPWRCRYCHNPHLLSFRARGDAPSWANILLWLERRRGLLDSVVFSGGEATLQPGLTAAAQRVRELGFEAALHTAGPSPGLFARILPHLGWVGFDFKAPPGSYATVTRRAGCDESVMRSLRLLRESGVPCEIRTTLHPALLAEEDLLRMADTLEEAGVSEWVIQRFRGEGCIDPSLRPVDYEPPESLFRRPGLRVSVR